MKTKMEKERIEPFRVYVRIRPLNQNEIEKKQEYLR